MDRSARRQHPTAKRLAELVVGEADPFTFSFREYARLVERVAPGTRGALAADAFYELPRDLRRIAAHALHAEIAAHR